MSRAQRRAQAATTAALAAAAQTSPGCADCTAHVEPQEVSPGVLVLSVMHDSTCPIYQAMSLRGHR